MQCDYHDAALCRSCTLLPQPYPDQLAAKDAAARAAVPGAVWEPPVASAEAGFRVKAKMVVGGTVEAPTLGILDGTSGVDLRGCALHTPRITAALPHLAHLVTLARLSPYDVATRRGELKHLLVTDAGTALLVRFVLRSTEPLARIRKHLPTLLATLGPATVVTVNLQPVHQAVLEGDREEVLTVASTLPMRVGDVVLHVGPRAFVQTNTAAAGELYRTAARWAGDQVRSVWDLYCGLGGFALHLARPGREVLGVELSEQAVAAARLSAAEAGLTGVRFAAGDAAAVAAAEPGSPDLVVVNPPRRGLGDLAGRLAATDVPRVLYSSCHVPSLVRDLAAMSPLRPVRARLVDMFPHTDHGEVLVLLERTHR